MAIRIVPDKLTVGRLRISALRGWLLATLALALTLTLPHSLCVAPLAGKEWSSPAALKTRMEAELPRLAKWLDDDTIDLMLENRGMPIVGLHIVAPATFKSYEDFFSKTMRKNI